MAEAKDKSAGRTVASAIGTIVCLTAGAWWVRWGVVVASTSAPQSRTFWVGATYGSIAAFFVGAALIVMGEWEAKPKPPPNVDPWVSVSYMGR